MKYLKHIFIVGIAAVSIVSCSKEGPQTGPESGAIEFGAGIGSSLVQTKVLENPDANHASHYLFTGGTKASVRMLGQWTGKSDVIEYTTATMGAETSKDSEHNLAPCDPVLFWDDFGSADAANTVGRARGLDVVAVAVDGVTTAPSVANNQWQAFPWALDVNQSGGWAAKDLLVSNNVLYNAVSAKDNAYKFEDRLEGKLLEFTHVMSKVTIRLTAGEGFPVVGEQHCFGGTPEVTLLNFKYTGSVDIVGKVITPTSATANLTPAKYEGGAGHTANYNALVYPGNAFDDETNIIRIAVDGNVYYINATKINAANTADGDVFEKGINYIINATLNKTNINVTATITGWDDVEAEEVSPEINVSAGQGTSGSGELGDGFTGFSFYRSSTAHTDATMNTGYSAGIATVNGFTPAEAVAAKPASPADPTTTEWAFQTLGGASTKLFWPTHDTHYQFRGVWPLTSTDENPDPAAPRVQTVDSKQVISIYNTAYAAGSYPSDLLIGRPEFENPGTETCHNGDHTAQNLYTYGICATTGLVNLNFRYMMSQVEVVLSTTDEEAVDHVELGENTVVEIVNGYNKGYVGLGDRVAFTTGAQGSYTLDKVAGAGNELKRHSAIVPQDLTFTEAGAETNLRFKITVTNDDAVFYTAEDPEVKAGTKQVGDEKTPATQDIYYADINPIKKSGSSDLVAPNGKWERGVHYRYNLKIKKTEIKVVATVTDWTTVEVEEPVWF